MYNKKSFKKVIITVLALTMILGTVVFAAEGIYTKKLTATYGRIKFNYEGSDVTSQIETNYGTPAFVTEGKSYVPVRAIGDLVGVDVDYDNATHTVKITDPKVEEHRKQLDDKDTEIAKLKAEITKLEKEVKEEKKEEVSKKDLKTLQTSLNKKYSEYEKVDFDIVLKEEKNNKITIDITTNLSNTKDEQNWIRMGYSDKKYLMEDAVEQVKKEFKDADITGNIYDSFSRKDLYTFSQSKNGSLSISNKDYAGGNDDGLGLGHGRLDSYVQDTFEKEGRIYGAKLYESSSSRLDDFEISFSETSDNMWEWGRLDYKDIEYMLDRIAWKIEDEYGYGYVRIYVNNLGTYTKASGSNSGTFNY